MADMSSFGMGTPPAIKAQGEHPAQPAHEIAKVEKVKSAPVRQKQRSSQAPAERSQGKAEKQEPEQVVEQANKLIEAFSASVRFMVDADSPNKVNVLMYDSRTGQVIRTLPVATLSQMVNKVENMMGVLFDFKA